MSRELRQDPFTGRWVVLSSERVPPDVRSVLRVRQPESCPFCPGNEHATTATIAQIERDGAWSARAFANLYPAMRLEDDATRSARGPYEMSSGPGAHEVIVETREHAGKLHLLPVTQLHDALTLARNRLRDLSGDRRLRSLLWFRNSGAAAGASLEHPHAQIAALPVVAPRLARVAERSGEHFRRTGQELVDRVLEYERTQGTRLLWESATIAALCPWAPVAPFEVWLVPRCPAPSFADADDVLVGALAESMHRVLKRLAHALDDPPYNASIATPPAGVSPAGFRWRLCIEPRIKGIAGFERTSGYALHHVFPEEAARVLRG